jgi:hypothetical protein
MTRKKRTIDGNYVPHTRELLEAPAWRVLSLSGHRVLDRIEIEHLRHGGKDNGELPVTFNTFEVYGIHRHAIAPALRECAALSLVRITRRGSAGNAGHKQPNHFLLTYLPAKGRSQASNEWRRFKTVDEADAVAQAARVAVLRPRQKRARNSSAENRHREKQNSSAGKRQVSVPETGTTVVTETGTGSPSDGNRHYYLDASHRVATGDGIQGRCDASEHGVANRPAPVVELGSRRNIQRPSGDFSRRSELLEIGGFLCPK